MPALRARDLVEWIAARGGRVVAGTSPPGLDRAVAGVARPLRLIPRELDAITPHDAVIFSFDAFAPAGEYSLEALIVAFAETQAALIVAGLGIDSRTERACALADQCALPVIAFPMPTDLVELARGIAEWIQQGEVVAARFVRSAILALHRQRLPDDRFESQAQALADVTRLYCLIEDDHRVMLLTTTPNEPPCAMAQVVVALASHAARQAVRPATPVATGNDIPIQRYLPGGLARAIVPLRSGTTTIAYLSLLGPVEQIAAAHVDLLWQVAPAFASALGKLRKQQIDWRHTASEDLDRVLRGDLSEGEAIRKAQHYGMDLTAPAQIALLQPFPVIERELGPWSMVQRDRIHDLAQPPWATALSDGIALAVPAGDVGREQIERVLGALDPDGSPVAVGMGRAGRGSAALCRSLAEARQAVQVQQIYGAGISEYRPRDILRLLAPRHHDGALALFAHDLLDPLFNADSFHTDALLETLDAWFTTNGNLSEAARHLGIHRNTLMYRLRRIEGVLEATLDDPDLRLSLQVALKIWHLAHTPHA